MSCYVLNTVIPIDYLPTTEPQSANKP